MYSTCSRILCHLVFVVLPDGLIEVLSEADILHLRLCLR
nr:MAG TPA: hypothetical protein [Caudoviricetes sp.]